MEPKQKESQKNSTITIFHKEIKGSISSTGSASTEFEGRARKLGKSDSKSSHITYGQGKSLNFWGKEKKAKKKKKETLMCGER